MSLGQSRNARVCAYIHACIQIAVRPGNLHLPAPPISTSKNVFEDLDLRSFVVGHSSLDQNSDLCTYSQYSKIPPETKKFLFNELASSQYR